MSTDNLALRCEELRPIVLELTPAIIQAMGSAAKCQALLPMFDQLREVVRLGSGGIDHPAYLAWIAGAADSIDAMQRAAEQSDPGAVWAAFMDERAGIKRLSDACVGYPGW